MTATTDLGFVHGFTHIIDSQFMGAAAGLLLMAGTLALGIVLVCTILERRSRS